MKRDSIPLLGASALPVDAQAMRKWRSALVALAAVLAVLLFAYWGTAMSMVEIWSRSETFAHGFVVAPASAWLIWRRRHELAQITPSPSWWILLPVIGVGCGWLFGQLAATNVVTQFAFVTLVILAVAGVLGTQAARMIAFPLAFLYFSVPIGEFLLPTLMQWTADFTIAALRASGVPVYREGQQFVIPTGHWSVVEACSGVRYLSASLLVGTLYAYLNYRSLRRRLLFVGVAIIVPVIANWLRAYMIVMLGHLSGNRLAVGVDHLIYGWVFFGVVIALVFWVGSRWREDDVVRPSVDALIAAPANATNSARFWLAAAALMLAAGIWPLAERAIAHADAAPPARLVAPVAPSGWREAVGGSAEWQPRFVEPTSTFQSGYGNEGQRAGLYIAYYRNQDLQRKLVSSNNYSVASNDATWRKVDESIRPVDLLGTAHPVKFEDFVDGKGTHLVVARWYWVDGKVTSSDYVAKIYTLLSRLEGRGDDGAAITVSAIQERQSEGGDVVAGFARDAWPSIAASLAQTRERR